MSMEAIDTLFGLSPYRHWYSGAKYRDNWEQTARKVIFCVFFGALVTAGCFIGALPLSTAISIGVAVVVIKFALVHWITRPRRQLLNQNEAQRVMLENGRKAILRHRHRGDSFAVDPELIFSNSEEFAPSTVQKKIKFSHYVTFDQGPRAEMEDEHLYTENRKHGTFAAVLDGHGGKELAQYAAARMKNEFFQELEDNRGNVHATFEKLFHRIHKGALDSRFHSGATVTALYVNKLGQPFIASIGDAETKLFRKIEGIWRSIPFARVLDWSDPEEAKRLAAAQNNPAIAADYPRLEGKNLRYAGLNVSSALGDTTHGGPAGLPAVIHKAQVSTLPIRTTLGDRFILGCDGLWDHVDSKQMNELLNAHLSMETLVPALVATAISRMKEMSSKTGSVEGDNVTVIGLEAVAPYAVNRSPITRTRVTLYDPGTR